MFNIRLNLPNMHGMPDQRSRRAMEADAPRASHNGGMAGFRDAKPQRSWQEVMADMGSTNGARFVYDADKRTDLTGVTDPIPSVEYRPSAVEAPRIDIASAKTESSSVVDTYSDGGADLDDALSEAQLGAIEHRKAAEALLREACMLEERLANEAAAARAARLRLAAQEKAALAKQATALEQEAIGHADDLAVQLTSTQMLWNEVNGKVAERKLHFEQSRQLAQDAEKELKSEEGRAADCAATQGALKRDIEQAARRVAEYRAAREAAEKEAVAAQQRLVTSSNGASKPANGNSELEKLQFQVAEQSAAHQLVT
ncbi:MAG: hypothetical protein M3160_00715 [Candidatus Eremiobacteraeota bacterium]|nr:hypothetical protein [Candidatus Eremiobacteraeota bacterium]